MKYNTAEVANLQPDYLGFIFYERSSRDFKQQKIPEIPSEIQKVGVFVDADIAFAKAKVTQHQLDVLQLHGNESPEYIEKLKKQIPSEIHIWKVFSIKDHFDFKRLMPYEGIVDKFLFDTKGAQKGGNGYTFDWEVLKMYPSKTPFILSGGIGLEEIEKLEHISQTDLPIYAIDVNSKFEIQPGLKDIELLQSFTKQLDVQNPSAKAEDLFLQEEQFYFYITTNTHNKVLYTGFTTNLKKRINEHTDKAFKNSFTAKYNLDKLIYFETFKTVAEARARERQVKKWNREWKNNLVNDMNPDWKDLSWML